MNIIDMHCDTISTLMDSDENLLDCNRMINLNKLKEADYLLQFFAMFIYLKDPKREESAYDYCNKMIDRYESELKRNTNSIKPVYTYEDIENNIKDNVLSSLLTIEEGGVLEGKMENLQHFFDRGVRLITLTWNFKNEIATPNNDFTDGEVNNTEPNTTDGLTAFGIQVVRKMNELGMVIDCSHASDKTFFDVIRYSSKPIVCSHSCARGKCSHLRNMTDEMLYKLRDNGGVVGINFCHDFITDDKDKYATIDDVVNHIVYIKELIGVDYVALGSDFDGIENDDIQMKDATYMPMLLSRLKIRGFSSEEIDKISHLNVLRVLQANLK